MDELRLILLGIGVVVLVLIYLWGMRKQIRERIEERRRRAQARVPENEPQIADDDTARDNEVDIWSEPEIRVIRPATSTPPKPSTARTDAGASKPADAEPVDPEPADPEPADPEPADSESVDAEPAEPEPAPAEPAPPAPSPEPARKTPAAGASESRPRRWRTADEMTVLLTVMAHPGQQLRGGAIRVACEGSDLVLGDGGVWECRSEATEDQAMIFGIAHLREPGTFSAETLNTLETPGLLLFMQLPGPLDPVPAVDLMIAVAGRLARRLGATVCDRKRNRMSTQAMIRLRAEAAEFERHLQDADDP